MSLWSPQDEKRFQDLQAKRRLAEEARNGKLDAVLRKLTHSEKPSGQSVALHVFKTQDVKDWLIHNADAVVDALEPFRNAGREAS